MFLKLVIIISVKYHLVITRLVKVSIIDKAKSILRRQLKALSKYLIGLTAR